jgi:hypothetical protein
MECYYGLDAKSGQVVIGYVGSMGEGGVFVGAFTPDGKALAVVRSGPMGGQAMASRSIMHLDEHGAPARLSVHALLGTDAPSETYTATYLRTTR